MSGYTEGPILQPWQSPWPLQWESNPDIDDGHPHRWERVHLLADGQYRRFEEDVVRCAVEFCHAPRCGESGDEDPCMELRHHAGLHIHLSGGWRPLGDLLPEESP